MNFSPSLVNQTTVTRVTARHIKVLPICLMDLVTNYLRLDPKKVRKKQAVHKLTVGRYKEFVRPSHDFFQTRKVAAARALTRLPNRHILFLVADKRHGVLMQRGHYKLSQLPRLSWLAVCHNLQILQVGANM
jgi:hypothetical protein